MGLWRSRARAKFRQFTIPETVVPVRAARLPFLLALGLVLVLPAALPGCGGITTDADQTYSEYGPRDRYRERYRQLEGGDATLFGDLSIGGPARRGEQPGEGAAAVNLFLWRASLETLSLGPLESADPFGGVIITDWFTLEEDPANQYRVTAYILGRALRADNVRVALYVRGNENGQITTRRATPEAESRLENLILSKARTIRATQYR